MICMFVLHLLGGYLTLRGRAWFPGDQPVLFFPIGSLLHSAAQAVKNQTQALASFSRKQWGMWSLRTVLRPGCCELARSCNLHQPTHSNYNTYNTQHVWKKTRRKSSGGSGGGEDFCYKTTPSSSGSMAVWSSNSPLCAKCMRCSFHMFPLCYALAWNFGRRSGMTRKTLVREMSTVFFALWGLSRLRVRDDSLCDLADCFCISMEICLLVDPEDACWETNWCEIEHVFSFLSFSLYLSLSLSLSVSLFLSTLATLQVESTSGSGTFIRRRGVLLADLAGQIPPSIPRCDTCDMSHVVSCCGPLPMCHIPNSVNQS